MALVVAALGIPAAAMATASLVRTRDIANGAVTNPKIRNNAVGAAKIRNNAVTRPKIAARAITGAKVANNTLTGRTINESTLQVTRIARRMSGNRTVTAPPCCRAAGYPLANNTYRQPAGTTDVYFGTSRVRFPAGCTRLNGARWVVVEILVNGDIIASNNATVFGTGQVTTDEGITAFTSGLVTKVARERRVTARVFGICGSPSNPHPQVLSVHVDVARFR